MDDLGALRVEELRLSCDRLGIEPPVLLGFHDSARGDRQRHGDARALANVDMLEVEAAIRRVIQDVTPHVILTFDPHGGYYHPDHLAVQRATTAAFFSSGTMGAAAPERLFYGAMLRDVFRGLAEKSRGRGITDGLDPDVFGTAAEMIAVSFDATLTGAPEVPGACRAPFRVRRDRGDVEQPATRRAGDAGRVPACFRAGGVRPGRDSYVDATLALERLLRWHSFCGIGSGECAECFGMSVRGS